MDKENLKQELARHSGHFTNGGINCEGITLPLTKYIIDNFDDTPTTEQVWEKIAEIFEDDDPDMLKDVCMNVLKAFNGGYPMLVTEGHICTWNPDVGKPEIPAELAKKIENFKGKVNDDYIIYSIFLDDEYDNLKKDTHQWIKDNPGKLSRAVVNGYTIKKEPVWVVLKGAQYFHAFTGEYDESEGFEYVLAMYEGHAHTFTDKQKAEAVATLVDGTFKEWSE